MKLQHIDTARGIAILMVIMVHSSLHFVAFEWLSLFFVRYGQMGVQLFFVVSAFTLCLSADRRSDEKRPIVNYAIRRYFRIAPAYYMGILIYLCVDLIFYFKATGELGTSQYYTPVNILANATFIHGFVPTANNTIVPGGWSIATEMTFYLLFPMLFIWLRRFIGSSWFKAAAAILIFLLFSYLIDWIFYTNWQKFVANNNFLYYNLFNQLPVFVAGIAYYCLWKGGKLDFPVIYDLLLFVIFTAASVLIWQMEPFRGQFILVPCLTGISFVFLVELFRKLPQLNPGFIARIGQLSYSMYLIHFIFAYWIFGLLAPRIVTTTGPDLAYLVFFLVSSYLTFLLAGASEKYVEKPSIAIGKRIINRYAGERNG